MAVDHSGQRSVLFTQRNDPVGLFPIDATRLCLASTAQAPDDALVLAATSLTRWFAEQFEPKDLAQDYAELYHALTVIQKAVAGTSALSPRDTAVLRRLIVHSWRRLVLKHPQLPRELCSSGWLGHKCRVLVGDLLSNFPKPGLGQITLD